MDAIGLLGYLAGAVTAASQLPQAVKAWRTQSADDLSLWTLGTLALGLSLWIGFGVAKAEWPLIAANSLSLAITSAVIAAKVRFG